jgi:lysophospholipase L1-like esterase
MEAYPAQLARLVEGPVWNAGVSGDKAADVRRRIRKEVRHHLPRVVVVLIGINDAGVYSAATPMPAFERDLRAVATAIATTAATPALCSLFPVEPTRLAANGLTVDGWHQYDQVVRRVADSMGIALVDLARAAEGRRDLWLDGLHPSRQGSSLIAGAVADVLALEQKWPGSRGTTEGREVSRLSLHPD